MWQYNYAPYSDELYHHGIKGQKWGVRRYQNSDGSLTAAGKSRYGSDAKTYTKEPEGGSFRRQRNVMRKKEAVKQAKGREEKKAAKAELKDAKKELKEGYKGSIETMRKPCIKKSGARRKWKQWLTKIQKKVTYRNKKTKEEYKDYEVRGAEEYETRMKNNKIQAVDYAMCAAGAAFAAKAMYDLVKTM